MLNFFKGRERRKAQPPFAPLGRVFRAAAYLLAVCIAAGLPGVRWQGHIPFIGRVFSQHAWAEQSAPLTEETAMLTAQPEAPMPPTVVLEDIGGYPAALLLTIEALSLELPVIAELGEAALKVAPCLYAGPPSPAYPGNIVITGHNYRDKSHFGRLDELEKGDAVLLMDKYGESFRYEVYDILTIGPEDIAALEEYEGEHGLALVTCADRGKNRLLVRCRVSVDETSYP
jgi:LPXTG-site transpeptidase (sortase) family protein